MEDWLSNLLYKNEETGCLDFCKKKWTHHYTSAVCAKDSNHFRAVVGKLNELKCTLYDTRENDRGHSALSFVVARLWDNCTLLSL